jgi:hypothetical protein
LKPGGIVQIEVPSSKHLIAKLIDMYYWMRGSSYVTHLSPMHSPFHLYEFGLNSFVELGKNLGFKIESYRYDIGQISFVPKMLHALLARYMNATDTGMQLTVYLRK